MSIQFSNVIKIKNVVKIKENVKSVKVPSIKYVKMFYIWSGMVFFGGRGQVIGEK